MRKNKTFFVFFSKSFIFKSPKILIDLTSDDGFLIAGFVNVNCLPTLLHHLFTLKTHELVKPLIYLVEQFPKSFDSKKVFFFNDYNDYTYQC